MSHAHTETRSETSVVNGHVITRGCRYRTDLQRWEPLASVRASWAEDVAESLPCQPEDFQDTPEDAFGVAQRLVDRWLADHPA